MKVKTHSSLYSRSANFDPVEYNAHTKESHQPSTAYASANLDSRKPTQVATHHLTFAHKRALSPLITNLRQHLCRFEMQRRIITRGRRARIDEALDDRVISFARIPRIFESSLARKGHVFEPVEKLWRGERASG